MIMLRVIFTPSSTMTGCTRALRPTSTPSNRIESLTSRVSFDGGYAHAGVRVR